MRANNGYSLIELMVALLISTVLAGALFSLLNQVQIFSTCLASMEEQLLNLHLTPVLLVQWLAPAGCNLETDAGLSPPGIRILEEGVSVRSDNDGRDGFPDGALDSSFEDIQIRQGEDGLVLKSGRGSFQPVLRVVEGFSAAAQSERLLELDFEAGLGSEFSVLGSERSSYRVNVFTWNYHETLFPR